MPALNREAGGRPEVSSLHVTSRIAHRYARTVVCCRLTNRSDTAREAQFSLVLPETAFISSFVIETEGKVYEAYVRGKEEAQAEYSAAVAVGRTAAHVAVSARDAHAFRVEVLVEPAQEVALTLTYEELLARRLGAYTLALHVAPGQVVRDLRVEALIEERRRLTALRAPVFRAGGEGLETPPTPGVSTERLGDGRARVLFAPSPAQQQEIAAARGARLGSSSEGLEGQLVIQYDVERDPRGGEVLVDEGYFVHFFAPDDLPPLPKHVIFVLDVSGSMYGRKIQQLQEAMITILDDLRPGDYFDIIEFQSFAYMWNLDSETIKIKYESSETIRDENFATRCSRHLTAACCISPCCHTTGAFPASAEYVQKAKETVNNMQANGGTNIYDALAMALALARNGVCSVSPAYRRRRPESIVLFLTDGEPTVGVVYSPEIVKMVCQRNSSLRAALYCLAFGADARLPFLKQLGLRNRGFARRIYEAADAVLQLRDFYREVASPLLSKVTFQYASHAVDASATTRALFPAFFAGSEMVVAGRRAGAAAGALSGEVRAEGMSGESRFALAEPFLLPAPALPSPSTAPKKDASSLERLWAYLTVRQLLEEREANSDLEAQREAKNVADDATKRALALALQYSFVTPVTSLVVVKPEGKVATNPENALASPAPDDPVPDSRRSLASPAQDSTSRRSSVDSYEYIPSPVDRDLLCSTYVLKKIIENDMAMYMCEDREAGIQILKPGYKDMNMTPRQHLLPVYEHELRRATIPAIYALAMSVLVTAFCGWRLGVNASDQEVLGDVYYGVRAAYCVALGVQVTVGLMTAALLWVLRQSARCVSEPHAWVSLLWTPALALATALEAVAVIYCNVLRYQNSGRFDALGWAEAPGVLIRVPLNVWAIYVVGRFYKKLTIALEHLPEVCEILRPREM